MSTMAKRLSSITTITTQLAMIKNRRHNLIEQPWGEEEVGERQVGASVEGGGPPPGSFQEIALAREIINNETVEEIDNTDINDQKPAAQPDRETVGAEEVSERPSNQSEGGGPPPGSFQGEGAASEPDTALRMAWNCDFCKKFWSDEIDDVFEHERNCFVRTSEGTGAASEPTTTAEDNSAVSAVTAQGAAGTGGTTTNTEAPASQGGPTHPGAASEPTTTAEDNSAVSTVTAQTGAAETGGTTTNTEALASQGGPTRASRTGRLPTRAIAASTRSQATAAETQFALGSSALNPVNLANDDGSDDDDDSVIELPTADAVDRDAIFLSLPAAERERIARAYMLEAMDPTYQPDTPFRSQNDVDPANVGLEVETDAMCTVCLEPVFDGSDKPKIYRCGHIFHQKCINQNLERGNYKCPNCNQDARDQKRGRFN